MKNPKLSTFSDRFFPKFFQQEAPRLVEFVRHYLEWAEGENNPYWNIDNIKDFKSIDYSIDNYADYLKNELMQDFPLEYVGDLKYIMRNLVMIYQSKGTLASYKFFFKAVYDSFCTIFYPRDLILRVSDGKWVTGYYLYCEDIPVSNIRALSGKTITEVETGITGLILDVLPHYYTGETTYKYSFVISDNLKPFNVGNHITIGEDTTEYRITKIENSDGYWSTTDGFLSSDHVLQDGYYYQQFSYELTTLVPFKEWKDAIKKLFHPAGLKMFSRYQVIDSVNAIGCDGDNIRTTFLRWFIIKIYKYMLLSGVMLCDKAWKIKPSAEPNLFQFPYTADRQYLYKEYGIVNSVRTLTPNDLETAANASNVLVFNPNGFTVSVDWAHWKTDTDSNKNYYTVKLLAKHPRITVACVNNTVTIPDDRTISDYYFVFSSNGAFIQPHCITENRNDKNKITSLSLNNVSTDKVTIYSFSSDIFSAQTTYNIANKDIILKNVTKQKYNSLICFIGTHTAQFITDKQKYFSYNEKNYTLIIKKNALKYITAYELNKSNLSHQDRKITEYKLKENSKSVLNTHLPYRNVIYSDIQPAFNQEKHLTYNVFKFPYTTDRRAHYKTISTIERVENNITEILNETNESSKLIFSDTGILQLGDWVSYKFSEPFINYYIAGIKSKYPHYRHACKYGIIQTDPGYANPKDLTGSMPFIFVNGMKVPDSDISVISYGYRIPETYSGTADLFFIDNSVFKKIAYYSTSTVSTIIVADDIGTQLNKQRFLIFADGVLCNDSLKMISSTQITINKKAKLIELYLLANHEDYQVIKYKKYRNMYEFWNNKNRTLCCYNPKHV